MGRGASRRGNTLATWALACVLAALPARATVQFGDVQLSGNVESQNLVRAPEFGEFEFIQNRNTVRIRVDWDWLKEGRLMDRWNIPFIKESKFYLLYRGVYDGFYDLAPGGNQTGQSRFDDIVGGPIEGNQPGTCRDSRSGELIFGGNCANGVLRQGGYSRFSAQDRNGLKFENVLREVFLDVTLADAPITLRIGRQQVIWGEADQFRLMDIWNPLDVSWRFPVADTFDNFRVPLWLVKGIWDTGIIGPFQNTFIELVYNPFDFQPGQKVDWLPRPWSLPFPDPLRQGQIQVAGFPGGRPFLISPEFNLQGTGFHKGEFERNPQDASEFGGRIHFVTENGFESTVNYIYGRGKWVGTSPAFGVKIENITFDLNQRVGSFQALDGGGRPIGVAKASVTSKVVHPYVHVFGITGNYFEADYTSAVLRFESAWAMGEPYATSQEDKLIDIDGAPPGFKAPVGFTKRDVWAGMLGFDRPTWIRWLNNKATWFISGQFFWTHIPGHNVNHLREFSSALRDPYFTPDADDFPSLNATEGFGVWTNGPYTGLVERTQNGNTDFENGQVVRRNGAPSDNVKRWEFMTTLTMTTFYRGGTIVPTFISLFDPINFWWGPFFQLEYRHTNNLIFTFQERIFIPFDPPTNDPWFVGRFGRRSETGLIVTYQF